MINKRSSTVNRKNCMSNVEVICLTKLSLVLEIDGNISWTKQSLPYFNKYLLSYPTESYKLLFHL